MPTPTKFRLTLTTAQHSDKLGTPFVCESFEFEAWPSASCTLAQHFSAKAWYALQARLEFKEDSQ